MLALSETLHCKCALFRDEGQFIDVRLKVDEDAFPVPPIVLAACSDYFYAMFTNGMKESNQETTKLKDESITSNALKIILEFCTRKCCKRSRNKWVKITFLSYVNTLFWCTLECVLWHRVKWSPCITRSVYANMKSLEVSVCRDVVLKLLACFSNRGILHFFLSNFLTGCRQEDSTGRKRLKPRGKLMIRSPFSPRPPSQFHHSSPSHFPSLISNQRSRVPGMRAHDWIVGICQPRWLIQKIMLFLIN